MADRDDLLRDTNDAFYGGSVPSPTPTPTPQPKYFQEHMNGQPITPRGLDMHELRDYQHKA